MGTMWKKKKGKRSAECSCLHKFLVSECVILCYYGFMMFYWVGDAALKTSIKRNFWTACSDSSKFFQHFIYLKNCVLCDLFLLSKWLYWWGDLHPTPFQCKLNGEWVSVLHVFCIIYRAFSGKFSIFYMEVICAVCRPYK